MTAVRAACAVVAVLAAAACKKPDDAPETNTAKPAAPAPIPVAPPVPAPVPAKPGPPPKPFASLDEMATATIAMSEKIGAAVTAANGDCARMGQGLGALIGEIAAINARSQGLDDDPARKRELQERYGKQIQAQTGTWVPLVQKCQADAGVKAFFAAMP